METRRQVILSAGALALSGCATPLALPLAPKPTATKALIDGHCHLFNAKDLSAVRFLSYVVARHYPKQAKLRDKAVEDPDLVDLFFDVVLAVVGAYAAPTAQQELALLQGDKSKIEQMGAAEPQEPDAAQAEIVQRLTDFLAGKSFLTRSPSEADQAAEAELRRLIQDSAGADQTLDIAGAKALTADQQRDIVLKAISPTDAKSVVSSNNGLGGLYLPGLLEFVKQLKRYRHALVDELARLHRDVSHQNPQLLVPAMVDFGRWLRQDPDPGSTFIEQTQLWPTISRRKSGPAVHGYVAFCPLRQVEFEMNRFGPGKDQIKTACSDNPLKLVEDALQLHGFIGVKVYPPMGFRAATNAARGPMDHRFPEEILNDVFGKVPETPEETLSMSRDLGGCLDAAMEKLFDLCSMLGAPVIAHGGNSVGANSDTGELADPYYWKPVFNSSNAPPIMLAHYGIFNYWSADPDAPKQSPDVYTRWKLGKGDVPIENTWEYWLASYLEAPANRGKPIFADISYFVDALSNGTEERAKMKFRELEAKKLTAFKDQLVFGTDWVMLAKEKNAKVYSERIRAFVQSVFGDAYVEPIMRNNFLRYADLRKNSQTFKRISRVYGSDQQLIARLEAACA